ncbi:MAG: YncE family protein, partial [bacterium]
PTAQAKGASSEMTAAISSDGALLYLTGKELEWSDTVEGSYREKPLGIVAIDIETMTEVAHTELPISRLVISPTGETVLATGSWDDLIAGEFGNSSGLHLLDAKTLEPLLWIEPTDVPEYYELVYSADGRYAYGTEWFYGPSTIIVDTATLEVSQGPTLEAFNAELLQLGYVLDF